MDVRRSNSNSVMVGLVVTALVLFGWGGSRLFFHLKHKQVEVEMRLETLEIEMERRMAQEAKKQAEKAKQEANAKLGKAESDEVE